MYLLASLCFIIFMYRRSPSCSTNLLALWWMHLFWFLHSHLFMDHNSETVTHTRYPQQFHFLSWVQNLTLEQYHALHEVSWCLLLNRSLANTHTEKFKLYIFTHSTKSLNHTHVQLATLNYFTWRSRHPDKKYLQPAACMIAIYILTVYFRSWYFLALYVCIAVGDLPDMSCNEYEFVKNLSLSILWWNAIERFQYDRYTAESAVIWCSPSCHSTLDSFKTINVSNWVWIPQNICIFYKWAYYWNVRKHIF